MERGDFYCWILWLLIFPVTFSCNYGCGVQTTSPEENRTTSLPVDATVTKPAQAEVTEETEFYVIPADHAQYTSEMCIMCHHPANLSESHRGVQDDECLDCHKIVE